MAMQKTRIDDLPNDVKTVIVGAMDVCCRMSTYAEYVTRGEASDKAAAEKAFEAYIASCMLFRLIRNAFTEHDISRMLRELKCAGVADNEMKKQGE